MKGKKFNAHERHFKEKELKLKKEIKHLKDLHQDIYSENRVLLLQNEKLEKDNMELKIKYEKLLKYSKLSDDDMIKALERDESVNRISSVLGLYGMVTKF